MASTTAYQASSTAPRSSIDSSVSTVHLDRARVLLNAATKARDGLNIANAPDEFDKKMKELVSNEESFGGALAMRETPLGVQREVEAQIVSDILCRVSLTAFAC
jgi:hypothetical protein